MDYYAPKGLTDILPYSIYHWHNAEGAVRGMMERYQYREIRTPIMEKTEVFARGVGQDTDIVSKEMYTFEDKGGRSLTLRPECTAPVVRAYLEHKLYGKEELSKLYYIGPMFRYEAPQKGRSRQFHQYGAESIGSDDPALDAELIDLSIAILNSVGIEDCGLALNSIGCPSDRKDYVDDLSSYLDDFDSELCSDCQRRRETNPLRVLDCKEEKCKAIVESGPVILDYLCDCCSSHFEAVKGYLAELDLSYRLRPTLVRGLDYYTKTVFEIFSTSLGAQDALVGGGRYDGLVELFGGDPTPAVGFAGGIERIVLLLEEMEEEKQIPRELDVFVAYLDSDTKKVAMDVVQDLRKAGVRADTDYLEKSLQGQLGFADRYGAHFTVIVGPREISEEQLTVRDMTSGDQSSINLGDHVGPIRELLREKSHS